MANLAFLSTAHIHAKGWIEDTLAAGARVSAVWDDVADRGARHAGIAKSTHTTDLDQVMGDATVDGYVICAENTRHLPLLRRALASGKPVLCEKPLATTAADAAEISALCARHSCTLVNGYVYPFMGQYQAIARMVEERTFGQVTHVRFRNCHGGAWWRWFDDSALSWFHDVSLAGGGGMLDEGTHCVHALRMLFGPVKQVWATSQNLSGQYPSADDFGVVHLRFANGIFGTVEGSWVQTAGIKGLEIVGSKGALYHNGANYVSQMAHQQAEPVIEIASKPSSVHRLLAAIRGELDPAEARADLTAALDAVFIMDAAARSSKSGGWINL